MRRVLLGAAAAMVASGMAFAQTPAPASAPPPPGASVGAPPNASAPNPPSPEAKAAASGQDNQAVATTDANADQPAKGANSFTKGQARHRIQRKGYTKVTGLTKDADGVWRGTAQKDGQTVNVWLDYKGNVGQASS